MPWFAPFIIVGAWGATPQAEDPVAVRQALAVLKVCDATVRVDDSAPGKPVVAVQFSPNSGKVTDDDLVHLQAFPLVRSVALPNKQFITDAGLAHLTGLEHLDDFVLNGTKATAAGIVRFAKDRTKMRRLHLSGAPLRDDDLKALKNLTELRELSLRGTFITDEGAQYLKPFTKLRWLNLDTKMGRITDAALPHLKGLVDLEDLDLDRTSITDAGLEHLKGLQNLRNLQFAHTKVSDAGLEHLQALPNLKGLNARGTNVTKAGVDKLMRKLPEIRVGFGPAIK